MRVLSLILATLFLLGTTGLGFLAAKRGFNDARDIESIFGDAGASDVPQTGLGGELAALAESTGRMRAGSVAYGVAGLSALVLLVVTFMKKRVSPTAFVLVAAAVVGTFLSPQYDLGPLAPASARTLGYVITGLAAVGAGAAYLAWTLAQRRRAASSPSFSGAAHA